ncbi:unnamed protein product [Protopolystoma xenopodis]|uniref:Moybdenum cofactor oxidoreductase dimerisation domain-containing protein n=1 Tax=Protopolystoma xenopodis TaxID=117903 RepID=A0A448XKR7_9PLAT|nr:unnamed protein product [Protopolystoma xenopodis]
MTRDKRYAYSGGGRAITSVSVSSDAGCTWIPAQLHPVSRPIKPHKQSEQQSVSPSNEPTEEINLPKEMPHWAWTLWEATVEIPKVHASNWLVLFQLSDLASYFPVTHSVFTQKTIVLIDYSLAPLCS